MNPKELFSIWSPSDSRWATWAKPVSFTVEWVSPRAVELPDMSAWREYNVDTALIVNLPAIESVACGVALAKQGFCPVPLFNALAGQSAIIDVTATTAALLSGAEILRSVILPNDAPPAFLIDSDRLKGTPFPGQFDNRWVVFPQDFPSGVFLRAHHIQRIVIIQHSTSIERDLVYILQLWKRAGLEIYTTGTQPTDALQAPYLKPVSRFRLTRTAFVATLIASFGLRTNSAGGFGSATPEPSRGG